MRSARVITATVVALIIGIAIGWYFGYTRPIAQANRDARKRLDSMEHDDRMTALVALHAIRHLEQQHPAEAKELLAKSLGTIG